jgi:diguanylate cyclase (GGDEF)-like protein
MVKFAGPLDGAILRRRAGSGMTIRRADGLISDPPPEASAAARLGVAPQELGPAAAQAVADLLDRLDTLEAELSAARSLADRDALTPLLNRRAFVRELARAIAFSQRYGPPASLVYLDVDGLKGVNDRLGHAVGDAVLQATAERLLSHVRASDAVGRMGGDEFAVLLVQTDGFQAEAKAAQLAAAVAQPLDLEAGAVAISVAWGVAQARPGLDAEALLSEADAAMYVDKRSRQSV